MRNRWIGRSLLAHLLSVALAASLAAAASAQQGRPHYGARPTADGTIPESTVINVRMDSTLTSKSSHVGDRFTATVTDPVYVNGSPVIPAGAIVEGHVTQVTPARRMGRSGTIAVEFDDLVMPDGTRLQLDASLTSNDPETRRQIDDENRVSGRNERRNGVFIGSGGVVGAVLGAIGGGAKGAVIGGAAGAGAVIAGILLSKGEEARVPSGTPFGVQLRRTLAVHGGADSDPVAANNRNDNTYPDQRDPVTNDRGMRRRDDNRPEYDPRNDRQPIEDRSSRQPVDTEPEPDPAEAQPSRQPVEPPPSRQPVDSSPSRDSAPDRSENESAAPPPAAATEPLPLNSPEMTRRAQAALRDEGYYEGEVTEQWSPRSTGSLKTYQRDHKLPESGSLDDATAKSLGLNGARPVSQSTPSQKPPASRAENKPAGQDTVLANVLSATAARAADGAIYILMNVQANTGGWRWYGDSVVNGDTLDVYARAVRPSGMVTQALTRGKIELNVRDGVQYVRRVVIHSAGADQEISLGRGTQAPNTNPAPTDSQVGDSVTGLARSIQTRAADLLAEHKRQLGMSGDGRDSGGRSVYSDADVELLFALNSFSNAANLYAGLIGNLQEAQGRRQATLDLARQARRTDRTIAVSTSRAAGALLPRWDVIRQDILRLMRTFNISTAEIEN
ncbi:MAG TPA: peptidoglycan-binding domain-containing protein [Blastocatellia bacterium]|nr:peptidoglycan-binding domain-containing protein [Blastocatellia bacterium]